MNKPDTEVRTDEELTCIDCNDTFIWTVGEQRFYAERGFTPPKHCKRCREKKKRRSHES